MAKLNISRSSRVSTGAVHSCYPFDYGDKGLSFDTLEALLAGSNERAVRLTGGLRGEL